MVLAPLLAIAQPDQSDIGLTRSGQLNNIPLLLKSVLAKRHRGDVWSLLKVMFPNLCATSGSRVAKVAVLHNRDNSVFVSGGDRGFEAFGWWRCHKTVTPVDVEEKKGKAGGFPKIVRCVKAKTWRVEIVNELPEVRHLALASLNAPRWKAEDFRGKGTYRLINQRKVRDLA